MILDTKAAFSIALRKLRNAKGMSQEDFSDVCSQVYMSQLEGGKKSPTLGMVESLAKEMHIHPLTLLLKTYAEQDPNSSPEQLLAKTLQELKQLTNS
jgi:transcriptional regulator with XRE-family HTH domain